MLFTIREFAKLTETTTQYLYKLKKSNKLALKEVNGVDYVEVKNDSILEEFATKKEFGKYIHKKSCNKEQKSGEFATKKSTGKLQELLEQLKKEQSLISYSVVYGEKKSDTELMKDIDLIIQRSENRIK